MSEPLFQRHDDGPVAVLTLHRPESRPTLTRNLIDQLGDALDRVLSDPNIGAAVLIGQGDVFCAGFDPAELAGAESERFEAQEAAVKEEQAVADLLDLLRRSTKPTIAAINGEAIAEGAAMALACDFAIASAGISMSFPEVKHGRVAALAVIDLVLRAGDRRARQLLLTGEPISAEMAEQWGLVNRVVPRADCLAAAVSLGRSLARVAPRALETTKRLLDEATGRPNSLRGMAAVAAQVRTSDEAAEGLLALRERRLPRWTRTKAGGGPPPSTER